MKFKSIETIPQDKKILILDTHDMIHSAIYEKGEDEVSPTALYPQGHTVMWQEVFVYGDNGTEDYSLGLEDVVGWCDFPEVEVK